MKKGFTLIELLIVIAILAILMSVIVITLNPAEMLRKSRDSKRIADLSALRTALNLYLTDVSSPDLDTNVSGGCGTGTYGKAFLSVPAAAAGQCTSLSTSYCVTSDNVAKVDGNGWVPVDLTSISGGSPIAALPLDPTNSTSSNLYYAYGCDASALTYELNTKLETMTSFAQNDGGNTTALYEVGSDPGLDLLPTPTAGYYQ